MQTFSYDYSLTGGQSAGTMTWTYNINGGPSQNLTSFSANTTAGFHSSGSISLSAITAANGNNINLVGTFTTFTGGNPQGGTVNFDNFSVTAVPEPITYAMLGFGSILALGSGARYYFGRLRSLRVA